MARQWRHIAAGRGWHWGPKPEQTPGLVWPATRELCHGWVTNGTRNVASTSMQVVRLKHAATSLVVNNSWGMFHPSWDYPVGHPGNYSDNPNHPFNRIVTALERAGADILFAAGNCGADCADGRCQGFVDRPIYGANSHPRVLSVAGVDVSKQRVGYSSIGPGRLVRRKPDLCGFTHFAGSGVYAADGGTSAATPVVAGVVAALRSRFPFQRHLPRTSPSNVRNLLRKTAEDVEIPGYDFKTGYGIVNGRAIARLFPIAEAIATEQVESAVAAAEEALPAEPLLNISDLSVHHHELEAAAPARHSAPGNGSPSAPRQRRSPAPMV
ncbi:MAG: S8 family serine peptidase [Deltaproteobacteria bacterium]